MRIIKNIKKIIKYICQDNLYKNASYLMISNIIVGVLGFVFLFIATHLYSTQDVGIYTTLISTMGLISLLAIYGGFYAFMIRFIPLYAPKEQNDFIFASFIFHIIIVIFLSLIFILFINFFVPKLNFLHTIFYGGIFVIFSIFFAISSLFNGVFTAYRKTKLVVIKNVMENSSKIILLPLFTTFLCFGIFYSYGIGIIVSVFVSFFLLSKIKKMNDFKASIFSGYNIIRKNFDYISASYLSMLATSAFGLLLPLLIINLLSAESTAYFFIAWSIFSIFSTLITSVTTSFFVEGSYDEKNIKKNRNKGLKFALIIGMFCVLLIFLFGNFILALLGKEYLNSSNLLYVFSISIYLFASNRIYSTILSIRKKMREIVAFNFLITGCAIGFSVLFLPLYGLIGIGYGWILGQFIGVGWTVIRRERI
ncbi:MAG: hypothetical protein BWK75_00370 [Candidatus Altiarchaeales archaeon A3]|nr:MAG: hypothetical protein BWK75_00370 [Candidatus Altiarchaeales archaeon A3]